MPISREKQFIQKAYENGRSKDNIVEFLENKKSFQGKGIDKKLTELPQAHYDILRLEYKKLDTSDGGAIDFDKLIQKVSTITHNEQHHHSSREMAHWWIKFILISLGVGMIYALGSFINANNYRPIALIVAIALIGIGYIISLIRLNTKSEYELDERVIVAKRCINISARIGLFIGLYYLVGIAFAIIISILLLILGVLWKILVLNTIDKFHKY